MSSEGRFSLSLDSVDAVIDALTSARAMIAALNDLSFAPEGPAPDELSLSPDARLGMACIMDAIADRIDVARRHIEAAERS